VASGVPSPARAKHRDARVAPFQGWVSGGNTVSQGVALGFFVRPLRGKRQNSATSKLALRVGMSCGHRRGTVLFIGVSESRKVI
jgi:hypothetical protein